MYKTKEFKELNGAYLQEAMTYWIETRKHIKIVTVDIWRENEMSFGFIVYMENIYEL